MIKLSVAEYAKLNNISVQAVYKKINRLNTIEEKNNGRKQIFIIIDNSTDIKPNSINELNSTPADFNPPKEANSTSDLNSTPPRSTLDIKPNSTNELNLITIETLKEQLNEKDKQIERLYNTIAEKDKQLQEQFDKLTNLLAREQELQALSQRLLTTQEQEPKKIGFFERIFKRKREE